jgi:hypothetical protein
MAGFNLNNQMAGSPQNLTTTYKSQTRVINAASNPRRARYVEMEWSTIAVPNSTDRPVEWDLTFCDATGAGTSTAGTPWPQDSGTAIATKVDTAVSTGGLNFTAEPTAFTQADNWFNRGVNQRSGVLWQASPGYQIIQPATVSTGAVMRALSPNYAATVIARVLFDEL